MTSNKIRITFFFRYWGKGQDFCFFFCAFQFCVTSLSIFHLSHSQFSSFYGTHHWGVCTADEDSPGGGSVSFRGGPTGGGGSIADHTENRSQKGQNSPVLRTEMKHFPSHIPQKTNGFVFKAEKMTVLVRTFKKEVQKNLKFFMHFAVNLLNPPNEPK